MEPLEATDPRQLGVYHVRARLGEGGMGRVYLGSSPAGRAVALKVIHADLGRDPVVRDRFWHEMQVARQVGCLYTAPVIDSGADAENRLWLATAFVAGPTLEDVVTGNGPLPDVALWRLAGGLAEALAGMHTRNVVHRDLKPANVLLADDGPRVIDFGLSRMIDGFKLTANGAVWGTPAYMSPEQARGQIAGPASDVFSLGCVLAYAATGVLLFGGGMPETVLYRIVHDHPSLAGISEPLRGIVGLCLDKDPNRRPTPVQLVIFILDSLGLKTVASPTSFWPETVTELIRSYQDRISQQVPASREVQPPHLPGHPPGSPPDRAGRGAQAVDQTGQTYVPEPAAWGPVPAGRHRRGSQYRTPSAGRPVSAAAAAAQRGHFEVPPQAQRR